MNRKVKAAFAAHPADVRAGLEGLRELILQTARETAGVGPITEDLRWGQPSFLTLATGSGSTIRIDGLRNRPDAYAIFFHCQTGLVDAFKELYAEQLSFVGDRAIAFRVGERLPKAELSHCISMALTHHLRKKAARKGRPRKRARGAG